MKYPEIIIVDKRGATRYRLPIIWPVVILLAMSVVVVVVYFVGII